MPPPAVIEQDPEAIQVDRWRKEMFLELGFTVRQSKLLAAAHADWHEAAALLAAGCELDTAFRLLV